MIFSARGFMLSAGAGDESRPPSAAEHRRGEGELSNSFKSNKILASKKFPNKSEKDAHWEIERLKAESKNYKKRNSRNRGVHRKKKDNYIYFKLKGNIYS